MVSGEKLRALGEIMIATRLADECKRLRQSNTKMLETLRWLLRQPTTTFEGNERIRATIAEVERNV